VAVVSPEDSDLADFNWCAQPSKHTVYGARAIRVPEGEPQTKQLLHRVILQRILDRPLESGECVDHRDGDGLNNRRENLRLASHAENIRNQRKPDNNTSGHKGACWRKDVRKWVAQIGIDGKLKHLGYFDNIEDAAAAYREAADKYHGNFANYGEIP